MYQKIVDIYKTLKRMKDGEIYVDTLTSRPAANTVDIGTYCVVVDTGNIYQSDGTSWVVI